MRHANLEEVDFAKKAAEHFEQHPKHWSFGDLKEGTFLALKWGLGNDAVLVLKLDDIAEPVVYGNMIKKAAEQSKRHKVWQCRVILDRDEKIPDGFDFPPRQAVKSVMEKYGLNPLAIYSGWGHDTTKSEKEYLKNKK